MHRMSYLFTSESVSEGHPDKIADQISDAIIDHYLAFDPNSKVACETLVTTGQVILAGEIKSSALLNLPKITRNLINSIGYDREDLKFNGHSCGILSAIHEQSGDINQGVDKQSKSEENKLDAQGAGDQGMMFGYATNETENYMPLALDLAHQLLVCLSKLRKDKTIPYLRPDAKSQVTIQYSDDHRPERIDNIVISTQHDHFGNDEAMADKIRNDIKQILIPKVKASLKPELQNLFDDKIIYHINPTGRFVTGGPDGDTGLTGRKIIVDTYGGKGAHGGGAFSGKDPSKVDRSAAYAARHIAKNLVAAGVANEILVQVSYAIGVANPCSIFVNTYGTSKVNMEDGEIAKLIGEIFDLRPYAIEKSLKLRNPIYKETAAYGHMGKAPYTANKTFENAAGEKKTIENLEFFTWEKLDRVEDIQKAFRINA